MKITNDREIVGMRRSKGWAKDQVIFFVAQFSNSFEATGILKEGNVLQDGNESAGLNLKTFASFSLPAKSQLLMKVAISAVDI